MKALKIAFVSLLALAAAGCSVTHNRAYTPAYHVSLEVHPQDMQYLGETEISVEYQTYLGFIYMIDKINGEAFDRDNINISNFGTSSDKLILSNHFLRRAAYKVFEEYPDATCYTVSREVVNRKRMFLSADVKATATIRAYKLITK